MKATSTILGILTVLLAGIAMVSLDNGAQKEQFSEKAFFCPEDNCAQQLVKEINSAKKSFHAAIYSFTSQEIADALVEAKERGVEIMVITDYVQAASKYSKDEFLEEKGISVKIKKIDGGSMHNKFAIIDNSLVATGSFNYTENANERNDENLIFLANPELAAEYESEFSEIWQQAS